MDTGRTSETRKVQFQAKIPNPSPITKSFPHSSQPKNEIRTICYKLKGIKILLKPMYYLLSTFSQQQLERNNAMSTLNQGYLTVSKLFCQLNNKFYILAFAIVC